EEDISGKIAGGYPIQESAVNLANSISAPSDYIVSGGITQCNGSNHFTNYFDSLN
ncbi:hypothetical protein ACJMK2_018223, partial [Sinanodonta woodiana]